MNDVAIDSGSTTVLAKAKDAELHMEPFPHVVVRNALPADYYEELSQSFPTLDGVAPARATANNKRLDLLSSWGPAELPADRMPAVWRRFVDDHITARFTEEVFDVFSEVTVEGPEPGTRWIRTEAYGEDVLTRLNLSGPVAVGDIVARATLGVNTPVTSAVSVRGPHVDSPRKAYVGLFYVRHPDDASEGGDFAIYRHKENANIEAWGQKIDDAAVETVRVVKYEPNTYVLMLNTANSLHGVTVRSPTPYIRRFAITSGWFPGVDPTSTARNSLARF